MSVLNTARWDDNVRQWGMSGGPGYQTTVVAVQSGQEQRAQNWLQPRGVWNVGDRDVRQTKYQQLLDFFHRMRGRFYGFRVRDWTDYKDDGRGVLGTGIGTGSGIYQMNKRRAVPDVSGSLLQKITRPVGSSFDSVPELGNTVKIFVNAVEYPQGVGAGSCTVDDSTGLVTFHSYVYAIILANFDEVTFDAPHNLLVGETILIEGYTGSHVNGNGTWTVSAVPTSSSVKLTGFNLGTSEHATASSGWGPADVLTWTGLFDIPARFDTDSFNMNAISAFIENDGPIPSDVWVRLGSIPVIQLRE